MPLMRFRATLVFLLVATAVALSGLPSLGSEPPSQAVAVPTSDGQVVSVTWNGTIPPGALGSPCAQGAQSDSHTIDLTVPAGLYGDLAVTARFSISFDGPTDQAMTVVMPGSSVDADNGFVDADEFVQVLNPAAGSYQVHVCAFAGAIPQPYTGRLELRAQAIGVCRSDLLAGLDLQVATIPELQAAMEEGALTSRRLVEEYLARIAAFDRSGPALNSVRHLNPAALSQADALDAERARGGARGPLHGIPIMLKDNVGTSDMPTTAGSIALEGSIPLRESFLVSRLRAAGAIILGKLNLSEFANWVALGMPSGYSSLGGQVRNPYHFGDPSGSSSGSGVAAAMALATATIGTETSGSIISPSFANSIVGLKTTVGLVSRAGIIPLAPTFDTPGPMARSVTDVALVLGAITGVDPRDPATSGSDQKLPPGSNYAPFLVADALQDARIGFSPDDREALGAAERALFDAALDKLRLLGATLVETAALSTSKNVGLAEIGAIPNEFKHYLNRYLMEETVPDLRVRTLTQIIEYNRRYPDKMKYGQNLLEVSDATLGNVDEPTAVANRTAAIQGSRAAIDAELQLGDLDAIVYPKNVNVNVGAAAQYPSITVPAGYTAGGTVPFGISLLGPAYSEPVLIGFAHAFERATRHRVRPTAVNKALCSGQAATKPAVLGARTVKAGGPELPATGTGAPIAPLVIGAMFAASAWLGLRLRDRAPATRLLVTRLRRRTAPSHPVRP